MKISENDSKVEIKQVYGLDHARKVLKTSISHYNMRYWEIKEGERDISIEEEKEIPCESSDIKKLGQSLFPIP